MLNDVVFLEILEGKCAAGGIGRCLECCGEEADSHFGGQVDRSSCFD